MTLGRIELPYGGYESPVLPLNYRAGVFYLVG
ncbi:hypothetical protein SCRM01_186c [Synechococcus phage S-CRM01]|nr:hypothetical protein SCRM01_186c [Synechococcus phage S-CRM01]AEC53132.1 hypothetical protein SCRM01_186c [Synechococcus phage S-CRM01]